MNSPSLHHIPVPDFARTGVMGVVNVTPDSFSDGGCWATTESAIAHAQELLDQGADILDIGGESTRPGSARITPEQEAGRILPVIEALAADGALISVDTIHATTARAAVEAGAQIVNDVSGGLADEHMHDVVAETGAIYICQHWRGTPETMDTLTYYPDGVVEDVCRELSERIDHAVSVGVDRSRIIVDPGLGFAKTHPQSWELLAHTAQISQKLNAPILIGSSRKRFLALATGPSRGSDPRDRDAVTAATSVLAAQAGAWAVRVHDVRATRDAVSTVALWKEHQ